MQDRPTYLEMLDAVRTFLEADVVPALEGPKKFHARVAANVMAIVSRELQTEDAQARAEWERLDTVLAVREELPAERAARKRRLAERTAALCERIRKGDADSGAWRTAVLDHVRHTVVEKLAVANPKFLGTDAGESNVHAPTSTGQGPMSDV